MSLLLPVGKALILMTEQRLIKQRDQLTYPDSLRRLVGSLVCNAPSRRFSFDVWPICCCCRPSRLVYPQASVFANSARVPPAGWA